MTQMHISAVDYHTGGEPFRIVDGGAGPLLGQTILEKRRYARENLDHVRQLLINEPRGHADMYGCFITEPEDEGADLGVVFFHNDGYSTACGHGTIALVTWALESGRLPISGAETKVVVDVPSGRLQTVAKVKDGRVLSVRFRNVPSFVVELGVAVETSFGTISCDIAFGGAFYASVDVETLSAKVDADHLSRLIDLGREIKAAIESSRRIVHPREPELRDVYGVIFFERVDGSKIHQRNVTIFADGEVDRSPCGSGTSARLAILHASGEIRRDDVLVHESIVKSLFYGSVVGETETAGIPAVITEVEGRASLSGYHHFVLQEDDSLGTGFLLR